MKATDSTKLKDWYVLKFPEDDISEEINEEATFQDLFNTLDNYEDVYQTIGAYDSLVRERLFEGLCEASGHTYQEVYNQWLNN